MDISPSFVADGQAAIAVEPGQRALDDPAVAAEALAGIDALAGDAHPDVALAEGGSAAGDVVGLVGVAFGGTLAAASVGLPDRGTASSTASKTIES